MAAGGQRVGSRLGKVTLGLVTGLRRQWSAAAGPSSSPHGPPSIPRSRKHGWCEDTTNAGFQGSARRRGLGGAKAQTI